MNNESIFEVKESKSVTITEDQLTELMTKATSNAIVSTMEQAEKEEKKPAGLPMMYMFIGADISHELRKILFSDSDT